MGIARQQKVDLRELESFCYAREEQTRIISAIKAKNPKFKDGRQLIDQIQGAVREFLWEKHHYNPLKDRGHLKDLKRIKSKAEQLTELLETRHDDIDGYAHAITNQSDPKLAHKIVAKKYNAIIEGLGWLSGELNKIISKEDGFREVVKDRIKMGRSSDHELKSLLAELARLWQTYTGCDITKLLITDVSHTPTYFGVFIDAVFQPIKQYLKEYSPRSRATDYPILLRLQNHIPEIKKILNPPPNLTEL